MASRLGEYRAEAERCREMAAEAISPLDKEAWLQLAAEWRSLASIHERFGSPVESEAEH
jgi:hypothetical protein